MPVTRPERLPDFKKPPLSEVVLGVQFAAPQGYQQILSRDVWDLFRAEYPIVQEQPAIQPTFETFGLPAFGSMETASFQLFSGIPHCRYWFVRGDGQEIIQFQNDKMLHNWRKIGDESTYPRFEWMVSRFENELNLLQAYVASLTPQVLSINQCEISYLNSVVDPQGDLGAPSDWLNFLKFDDLNIDDFAAMLREVILSETGLPVGRLICDARTEIKPNGLRGIAFSLTVRGAPQGTDIKSALEFLTKGREIIVSKFANLTTHKAHESWGRLK